LWCWQHAKAVMVSDAIAPRAIKADPQKEQQERDSHEQKNADQEIFHWVLQFG